MFVESNNQVSITHVEAGEILCGILCIVYVLIHDKSCAFCFCGVATTQSR